MVPSTRIALLGFGSVEQSAFEAFFRVAGRRCPAYARESDPQAADFVIVDGADAAAWARAREAAMLPRTVVLGGPPRDGVLLQLARPLNLIEVVRALDEVVGEAMVAGAGAGLAAEPAGDGTVVGPPEDDGAKRRRPGPPLDHILVVDDSEVALRFMATHLQRFGFQVHLAQSGAEALERVAERHFEFVFLDVLMEGLDGFQTCKAIKRARYAEDQRAPTVVMLTCLASPADRLRGTMAGADAYLTKPLRELELLKVVGEREVTRHAYAVTAAASTRR